MNLVGIDLGTTMCAIAQLDTAGVLRTVPNNQGEPLTPSAIYIDGNQVVVGRSAKRAAAHHPHKVATLVKRDIGKPQYSRQVDGRCFRPETLSAMIIKKLKQDAERKIGPISQAVITVPAFFDDARRKATEDAGRIAGLDQVAILNEPTAAALAYCLEGQLNRTGGVVAPDFPDGKMTAVVYDLGGGTFDVTCIHLEAKQVNTLATDGAVRLGGRDWDDRIVKYIVGRFEQNHGVTIPPERRDAIVNQAENTKQLLSELPVAEFECFFEDRVLRESLTRELFEELTRDLLIRTEFYITDVVTKQARLPGGNTTLSWSDIDRVLLVGGSTRMPMVREMVRRISGKQPDTNLDPDQVVAQGAAVYAAILATRGQDGVLELDEEVRGQLDDMGIVDVNSHSLGIKVFHRSNREFVNAVLIPKNHPLPFAVSKVFPVRDAGTKTVRIKVLEGEAPEPEANIELGECVITDLPRGLPAKAPIQVRLSYGANGRVHVMALDMTGGRFAHAEIERTSGLTEQEIQRERQFVEQLNIQ
jgi:molecular chaperone DnaK